MIREVGVKDTINLQQFTTLFAKIEESMSEAAEGVGEGFGSGVNDNGNEEDDDDGEEPSPEELEEIAKELFDELRGKKNTVSFKKFKAWEGVSEVIAKGFNCYSRVIMIFHECNSNFKI
jgi:predicted Zn-dependent protease